VTDKHQPLPYPNVTLEEIGMILREAREREGLTKADVSSRTKITLEQINNLEEGRQPKIASVYARGFLRTYSELVKLENAEDIYLAYKHLTAHNDDDFDKPLTSKYMESDYLAENASNTWPIVIVVLIILAVGLIAMYFSPGFRGKVYDLLPEAAQAMLPTFGDEPGEQPAEEQTAAADQVAPAPTIEVIAPVIPEIPAEPQPEPFFGRLTLRAEKNTWAQVVVDNQPMVHLIFEPGQSQSFDGENTVHVIFGDGQALRMEWNGQDRGYVGGEGPNEEFFNLTPPET
jgi:cytoskeletal protein RodZ